MSTITATEARVRFGTLLRRVAEGGETIIVERGGQPQVVVLSVADYERLVGRRASDARRRAFEEAVRGGERIRAAWPDDAPDPVDVIREGRQLRTQEVEASLDP